MGSPATEAGDRPVPSAVLAAQVAMLVGELREHRRECVTRAEWELARAADVARIANIEAEQARQGNRRWQLVALGIGAAFTVFASLTVAVVTVALKINGG